MTSQPGQQTITMHILPNISQSNGNPAMKLGQVIEDNNINKFFFKSHAKNELGKLVTDLFLFFKKALYELSLVSAYNKNKLYKTLDY